MRLLFVLNFLSALLVVAGPRWMLQNILAAFAPAIIAGLVLAAGVCLFQAFKRSSALLVFLAIGQCLLLPALLSPYAVFFEDKEVQLIDGKSFELRYANIHGENRHFDKLETLFRKSTDFLVLLELEQVHLENLSFKSEFPYQSVLPRDDMFGLGVFSRHPLEDCSLRFFGDDMPPSIRCLVLPAGAEAFELIAIHAPPPVSFQNHRTSLVLMRRMATHMRNVAIPRVLAGDFNSSPHGTVYRYFKARTKLQQAFQGEGYQPSWQGIFSFPWVMIDHIFLSNDVRLLSARRLADIGSDHLPYEIIFRVREAEATP